MTTCCVAGRERPQGFASCSAPRLQQTRFQQLCSAESAEVLSGEVTPLTSERTASALFAARIGSPVRATPAMRRSRRAASPPCDECDIHSDGICQTTQNRGLATQARLQGKLTHLGHLALATLPIFAVLHSKLSICPANPTAPLQLVLSCCLSSAPPLEIYLVTVWLAATSIRTFVWYCALSTA